VSHFTRVKTRLHCIDSLKEALEAMGLAWRGGPCYARGFGSLRTRAELVVDTKTGLDVGFVSGDQGFELVADWELIEQRCELREARFVDELKRRYAYAKVKTEVERAGFTVVEERTGASQEITLRVRRWA
jgi:hypothetical protein